jgi:hypothetical protein
MKAEAVTKNIEQICSTDAWKVIFSFPVYNV